MSDDEVENLYDTLPKKFKKEQRHYDNEDKLKIKIPFQMCITGTTGSGKTNALIQLIKKMNCFENILLWAKDTEEDLYANFIEQIRQAEKKSGESILTVSNSLTDLPSVDSLNKEKNNLLILDDMITESEKDLKKYVEPYYIRGRKKECSVVFLAQDYFKIPITVRKNSSYFLFTKVDSDRDLTTILKDHGLGISNEQIEQMYLTATKDGFPNFFMIDKKSPPGDPFRFRKNYKPLAIPGKGEKEGKSDQPVKTSRPGGSSKGQKGRASGPESSKPAVTNASETDSEDDGKGGRRKSKTKKKRKPKLTKDTRFEKAEAEVKEAKIEQKQNNEEKQGYMQQAQKLVAGEDPAFQRVAIAYFQSQAVHGNYHDAFLELKQELSQLKREFEHDHRKESRSAEVNHMRDFTVESDDDSDMYDESRMGEGIGKRRRAPRKRPTKRRKGGSTISKKVNHSKPASLDQAIRRLAAMI